MLTDAQIDRYSRQIIVSEIGGRGQERLLAATVAVIGTGAIAHVLTPYLAGAGIGRLYLCPAAGEDPGEAERLEADLADVNPDTTIATAAMSGDWSSVCDVVVATTGDPQTLRPVVAAAARASCPLIAAGVHGSLAWLAVGGPAEHACVGCAAAMARAAAAGSTFESAAVGAIGALLALEVLRGTLQLAGLAPGRWLHYDGDTAALTEGCIARQSACAICV